MDERSTGKIKTVLSDDVENLELLLAHNVPEALMYGAGPVATFAFLLFANVPLALATLIPAIAALAVLVSLFKVMSSIVGRATKSLEDMNSVMAEYVSGMRTVRALDMGTHSFGRFRKAVDEENAVWCEISRKTGPGFASYVIIIEAGLLIMVPAGALMLTNGAIDVHLSSVRVHRVALPHRDQAPAELRQQALPSLRQRRARSGAFGYPRVRRRRSVS